MANYQVTVGNIGKVYDGDRMVEANRTYKEYVCNSINGYGRAAGEQVILWKDGEPIKEYEPPQEDE